MAAAPAEAQVAAVTSRIGREVKVFLSPRLLQSQPSLPSAADATTSTAPEESDEFYEFTAADYARVSKGRSSVEYLKTRKVREAEEMARMSRISQATLRVQFPDGIVLEANFAPSDPVQRLSELLQQCLRRPSLPFYLYTTPPKQRVKDYSRTMYAAGFAPGALVHFAYENAIEGGESQASYLTDDVASLKDLHLQSQIETAAAEVARVHDEPAPMETAKPTTPLPAKPAKASGGKPKWFKG